MRGIFKNSGPGRGTQKLRKGTKEGIAYKERRIRACVTPGARASLQGPFSCPIGVGTLIFPLANTIEGSSRNPLANTIEGDLLNYTPPEGVPMEGPIGAVVPIKSEIRAQRERPTRQYDRGKAAPPPIRPGGGSVTVQPWHLSAIPCPRPPFETYSPSFSAPPSRGPDAVRVWEVE